jgi:hypothetical protein
MKRACRLLGFAWLATVTIPTCVRAIEPAVVITYEGELSEFPRYIADDRYIVEIPLANHSKQIRGDVSSCRTTAASMVWSFINPPGRVATLQRSPGRIEISFSQEEPAVATTEPALPAGGGMHLQNPRYGLPQPIFTSQSASFGSSSLTLPPIATGSAAPAGAVEGAQGVTAADLKNQSISMAGFALDVPDSPAFAVLGLSPQNAVRPTNPQDLITSVLNGVDKNGHFQSGLAIDTAPYLLFLGKNVTLQAYQDSYLTRLLSRAQLSLASTKGAEIADKSLKLALGLHLTLLDRGDPRYDVALQDTYNSIVEKVEAASGPIPPGADMAELASRREEAMRGLFKSAFDQARQENWNRTNWSLGAAPSWISPTGDGNSYRWNGATVWSSFAYGFEGVPVLEKSSQLILNLQYRNHEETTDPDHTGSILTQDSVFAGSRLRIGSADANLSLDAAYVREWGSGYRDSVFRIGLAVERRLTKNIWFSLSAGRTVGGGDRNDATLIQGGFKIGYGAEAEPTTAQPAIPVPVVYRPEAVRVRCLFVISRKEGR